MQINFNEGGHAHVDRIPDHCPICHSKIVPVQKFGIIRQILHEIKAEIVFLCPNDDCKELFIAYYSSAQQHLIYTNSRPIEPEVASFEEFIRRTSPSFCNIYEQSSKAEQYKLLQICGVGYRKSLEFLIKDYLIILHPNKKEMIEKKLLGSCINDFVADPKLKQVARRAAWLGNDETHYQRRWEDKDLSDLKLLIKLTLHWIEAEHLTNEALASMPDSAT